MQIRNIETRGRLKARIEKLTKLRKHARDMVEIRKGENDREAVAYYLGRSSAYTMAIGELEGLL